MNVGDSGGGGCGLPHHGQLEYCYTIGLVEPMAQWDGMRCSPKLSSQTEKHFLPTESVLCQSIITRTISIDCESPVNINLIIMSSMPIISHLLTSSLGSPPGYLTGGPPLTRGDC